MYDVWKAAPLSSLRLLDAVLGDAALPHVALVALDGALLHVLLARIDDLLLGLYDYVIHLLVAVLPDRVGGWLRPDHIQILGGPCSLTRSLLLLLLVPVWRVTSR